MIKVSKKLIEETKAIIRLYLFLRHKCGLKYADRLSVKELREMLKSLSNNDISLDTACLTKYIKVS